MDYTAKLDDAIQRLHDEGRYRTFIDIERRNGNFPHAVWTRPDGGESDITVWCGNDYLGMGQNPVVLAAMHEALKQPAPVPAERGTFQVRLSIISD